MDLHSPPSVVSYESATDKLTEWLAEGRGTIEVHETSRRLRLPLVTNFYS